ncbi:hypothetical protein D3C73_896090 [compost metagenome]
MEGMNLHKKKYAILLPPFFIIGLIFLFTLPADRRMYYVFAVLLVFWLTYYSWIFIEEKRKKNRQ